MTSLQTYILLVDHDNAQYAVENITQFLKNNPKINFKVFACYGRKTPQKPKPSKILNIKCIESKTEAPEAADTLVILYASKYKNKEPNRKVIIISQKEQ